MNQGFTNAHHFYHYPYMAYLIVKQTKKTLSKGKFLDRESGEIFERERLADGRHP